MAQPIQAERCMRCGRMDGVVDGKLNHRQKSTPFYERLDVSSKYLFKDAVDAFCLTISLRMVRSGHS